MRLRRVQVMEAKAWARAYKSSRRQAGASRKKTSVLYKRIISASFFPKNVSYLYQYFNRWGALKRGNGGKDVSKYDQKADTNKLIKKERMLSSDKDAARIILSHAEQIRARGKKVLEILNAERAKLENQAGTTDLGHAHHDAMNFIFDINIFLFVLKRNLRPHLK